MVGLACARFGPSDAEDIVQDVLLRFFSRPRPAIVHLADYLLHSVLNQGRSSWRQVCRHRLVETGMAAPDLHDGNLSDMSELAVIDLELARVTAALGTAGVDLIAAYHDEGGPALATRLGINQGTLRVLIHGTRAALRSPKRRGTRGLAGRGRLARLRALAETAA